MTTFTRRSVLRALGAFLVAPLTVFQGRELVTIIKGASMGKTENLFLLPTNADALDFSMSRVEPVLSGRMTYIEKSVSINGGEPKTVRWTVPVDAASADGGVELAKIPAGATVLSVDLFS